jgi:hypothetical protein
MRFTGHLFQPSERSTRTLIPNRRGERTQSVDSLIELLERDPERREAAIKYRVDHHWEVQGYAFAPTHGPVASASVSSSSTRLSS